MRIMALAGLIGIILGLYMSLEGEEAPPSSTLVESEEHSYEDPPKLTVTSAEAEITATQGSYCWGREGVSKCVDMIYENPWQMGMNRTPMKVKNEKIHLSFSQAPEDGSLRIEKWESEGAVSSVFRRSSLPVPDKEGTYVYQVQAKWEEGRAVYGFAIEVE